MIVDPPLFAGGWKPIVARAFPGVAMTAVGGPGGVAVEVNVASTVQFAVIGAVVNVVPDNVPPQELSTLARNPESGVTTNVRTVLAGTLCVPIGEIVPLLPAFDMTVSICVVTAKVRDTGVAAA